MQAGNRFDEGQAKAAAGGRTAAVEAIEAVEHLVVLGRGNAGTVVGDLGFEARACLAQADRYRGAFGRMVERVLDQVGDHLSEELAVAGQADAVLNVDLQPVPGILGRRLVGLADAAHQAREVELAEGALLRTCFDLGDAQQGGKCFEQAIGLLDGSVGRLVVLRSGLRPLARILEMLAQAAERRAQVVGDVARNLAQPVHELLDAAQHGIEVGDELVELVLRAAHGNAGREVAFHDGAAGAGDGVDAAQEGVAEPGAAGDRQQQGEAARPREGAHDGSLHVDEAIGILGDQQERVVGQGEAIAGELGPLGFCLRGVGLGHEVDDAVDRRHAGQITDHDAAVWGLQEVEDRAARAEVHAPRDLVGEAGQAAAAMDFGELQRLGAQHGGHVVLHRRRRRHVDHREQRSGRDHEQHRVDQRQPEAGRPQQPNQALG